MQSPVSFLSTRANESKVRSGVGSSAEVSISKSFEEGAVQMLGRRDRGVCELSEVKGELFGGVNANMRPAASARRMPTNR
jgi:hypothetical protein